jgi:thiamine biosynthesis lipoprotein
VAAAAGFRRVEDVMGMTVYLDIRDPQPDPAATGAMFGWLRWVDATFSTYKPESEVSRIARGELAVGDAHSHVQAVLTRCDELRRKTCGYFDAAAGGELDPSGLVKGWSVDEAAAILRAAGLRDFAINAGGDIRLLGRALPDDRWRVGVQHPLEHDRIAAVVEGTDLAVATSGAYARGDHVLDPHTRRPPRDVLSVTVTGPDLATADGYATAGFAMGREGPEWTARLPGYEAMTILESGEVLTTPGFPSA